MAPYTTHIDELAWNKRPQHKYRCSGTSGIAALGKIRCANGAVQYKAYCLECGGKGTDLAYSLIAGLDEERIPVLTHHNVTPCERCGSEEGSEVHHWAPFHLFDDADKWPTSHLCKACHSLWHSIVTPNMSSHRRAA